MKLCLALLALASVASAFAAPQSSTPSETSAQKDQRMKWFKDARFGLFLHWGLYSTREGEWNGKTNYAEWILEEAHIPVSTYEKFQQGFNPVDFDADKWVSMAKNAGMKYVVITTKHHEGFNMFASKYSDYNVMNTPFHRDPMKELAAACKKYGLKMCFYHSIMDWHHPDYLPRRSWEDRSAKDANFRKYVQYLKNDLTQLLTEYGPIGIVWFDGEWENTWNHEDGQAIYDLCRKLQPKVIVNNRVDVGRSGVQGMSTTEGTAGDYGTPEQNIPPQGIPGSYWETCMTMNDHWGYNKTDLDYKTDKDLIQKLADISSKGGNFLLNIGPTPKGDFPPLAQARLKAFGDWMKTNSDAVYSTDASPFPALPWGRCTQKSVGGNTMLYLDVFDWPTDGKLVVPGLGNRPKKAFLLADRSKALEARTEGSDVVISLPSQAPDANCSVVALEISGKPIVYVPPTIKTATDLVYKPISVSVEVNSPKLSVRYTTDGSEPDENSPLYTAPLTIGKALVLNAKTFDGKKAVSETSSMKFRSAEPSPAVEVAAPKPGLSMKMYEGSWAKLPDFDTLTPKQTGEVSTIGVESWPKKEFFGVSLSGFILVPETGVYQFSLTSDDGSKMELDGKPLIDNDGNHAPLAKNQVVALAKGLHRIRIDYYNGEGDLALKVGWSTRSHDFVPVDASSLFHG